MKTTIETKIANLQNFKNNIAINEEIVHVHKTEFVGLI